MQNSSFVWTTSSAWTLSFVFCIDVEFCVGIEFYVKIEYCLDIDIWVNIEFCVEIDVCVDVEFCVLWEHTSLVVMSLPLGGHRDTLQYSHRTFGSVVKHQGPSGALLSGLRHMLESLCPSVTGILQWRWGHCEAHAWQARPDRVIFTLPR